MIEANKRQGNAVTAGHAGPVKIVAGAGTGKTWTMVERFAHLVSEHGLDANRIVAVTFTNRAAADLRERVVDRLLQRGLVDDRASLDGAWIGTFHGLCVRLLRDNCYEIGFDRDTRVINELDERLLVHDVLTDLRNGDIPAAGILEMEGMGAQAAMKVSTEAFAFIQRMKGRGLGPDALGQRCVLGAATYWRDVVGAAAATLVPDENERVAEEEVARLVCATYQEYEQRLATRGMLDFDGILLRVRDALLSHSAWAERVRERFQYLIVDEFQDTSAVQHEVLRLLAQDGFANVSVVGDPKQSIYGWRDALIENLIDFSGDEHRLLTNYRSVQPILDLATHVIRCDLRFADEPPLVAENGPGDERSVCMYRADTPEEEARFVADQIVCEHLENATPWSEIALLTRMRRPPVAFEQELRAHGIPYVTSGGQGFFDREEIKDVMAYLAVIDDPLNDMALVRLLQGPLTRLSDGQLYRLLRGAQNPAAELRHKWDLVERAEKDRFALLEDDAAAARLSKTLTLVHSLAERRAGMSVGDLVQAVIDETGYAALAAGDAAEAPRRMGNLRKLYRMASDFEASQAFTGVDDFIHYVDLHDEHNVDVSEADISGSDAVRVMTIHAAKGLEFPVVFLAQVKPVLDRHEGWMFFDDEFGLILKNLGGEEINDTGKHQHWVKEREGQLPRHVVVAEARRLMYVATTRAKHRLFVSATRRKEPTWDAVLADTDEKGRPRQKPELDHFRTMALFLRAGGVGTLLEAGDAVTPRALRATVEAAAAAADVVELPQDGLWMRREDSPALPERPVVSFSQLEVLAQCGLRYRYMFEWRLPAPPDDLWPKPEPRSDAPLGASDLGTLVHAVLEVFHQPGATDGAGGIDRLHQIWDDVAGAAVGPDRAAATWNTVAARMFENYLSSQVAAMSTIATEQEVNLVVDVSGQPVMIRGFIDRVCRDDAGKTWVVDYKTNRSLGAESLAVYGRQLAIYKRAVHEALGIEADPLLLEMRTGREHRLTADGWPGVRELLTTLMTGERSAPVDPPCGGCAYNRACPASTRRGRQNPSNQPSPPADGGGQGDLFELLSDPPS
jgi:DNA helicase-2/ATP-dependent DNA helicase PcrA